MSLVDREGAYYGRRSLTLFSLAGVVVTLGTLGMAFSGE
jgi:hypothetical protein